jgi:hypothetical protein
MELGNGRGAKAAAIITSAHATTPAMSRGRSKKPPEKKATAVGPAAKTPAPMASAVFRIRRHTRAACLDWRRVASAVTRCTLAVVALAAGAWLVLSFRAVELEQDAGAAFARAQRGEATRDDIRHGDSLLRRARLLNADTSPLLAEGLLLFAGGRRHEGLATAERVVTREPENVGAWLALHVMYSRTGDAKGVGAARREVRALNPLAGDVLDR